MKKLENFNLKKSIFTYVRLAGITFGMLAFLMACDPSQAEKDNKQENGDSVKKIEIQKVDTIAKQDTTKKVDQGVKKP